MSRKQGRGCPRALRGGEGGAERDEKTFEIEIINELSASVYNRVLNYVLNHELNKNDSQLLEVNLLNQLPCGCTHKLPFKSSQI